MSNNQIYALLGQLWDAMPTTKEKLQVAVFLVVLLVAAVGFGYKMRDRTAYHERAKLEASHERELASLETNQTDTDNGPVELTLLPRGYDLPSYQDAQLNDISMKDMHSLYHIHETASEGYTDVAKGSFFNEYKGQRFTWRGYVKNVSRAGMDQHNDYYCVTFSPYLDPQRFSSFTRQAYFAGHNVDELLYGLRPNQEIVISGVMDDDGALTKSKIIEIGPRNIPPNR